VFVWRSEFLDQLGLNAAQRQGMERLIADYREKSRHLRPSGTSPGDADRELLRTAQATLSPSQFQEFQALVEGRKVSVFLLRRTLALLKLSEDQRAQMEKQIDAWSQSSGRDTARLPDLWQAAAKVLAPQQVELFKAYTAAGKRMDPVFLDDLGVTDPARARLLEVMRRFGEAAQRPPLAQARQNLQQELFEAASQILTGPQLEKLKSLCSGTGQVTVRTEAGMTWVELQAP
jgi:hypothetical protein